MKNGCTFQFGEGTPFLEHFKGIYHKTFEKRLFFSTKIQLFRKKDTLIH